FAPGIRRERILRQRIDCLTVGVDLWWAGDGRSAGLHGGGERAHAPHHVAERPLDRRSRFGFGGVRSCLAVLRAFSHGALSHKVTDRTIMRPVPGAGDKLFGVYFSRALSACPPTDFRGVRL